MDGFNGLDESVPGQIAAGPLQPFNQNPGIDESLQAHKAGPVFGVITLQKRQVAGLSGKKRTGVLPVRVRRRNHLRHDHRKVLVVFQPAGQLIGPDKGNQVENRTESLFIGHLDECGARVIGADHHHGLGARADDFGQPLLHIQRAAVVRAAGNRNQVEFLKRQFGTGEAVESIGIVLVKNGDFLQSQVGHQMADSHLGFLVIGGPHIDQPAIEGISQGIGAGEHSQKRNLGFLDERQNSNRRRGSDVTEKGENLIIDDEALGIGQTHERIIAVIMGNDLDRSAMNAAQ